MNVTSQTYNVNASKEKMFSTISNCQNFTKFIPEQMQNVEVTEESCKFSIPGMATITLTLVEKIEFAKVVYQANNDKNIPLNLIFHIDEKDGTNNISVEISVDIPIFLAGMVKKPLQNAVEMIGSKLPQAIENN